jgi:hypothetical protein
MLILGSNCFYKDVNLAFLKINFIYILQALRPYTLSILMTF